MKLKKLFFEQDLIFQVSLRKSQNIPSEFKSNVRKRN